jgi:hypothetical protein
MAEAEGENRMSDDELIRCINKLKRYNYVSGDFLQRRRGEWVAFEDVKTVICQAIADAKEKS